jgi:predicted acyl esterase
MNRRTPKGGGSKSRRSGELNVRSESLQEDIMRIPTNSFRRCAALFLSLLWSLVAADFAACQQAKPPEANWQAGFIPMKDQVQLAYLLYKPAKEGRFPVLLTYDGNWGGGMALRPEEFELLGHGYAVIGVSVRGTGASGGVFAGPFTKQEGEDGKAVIEWLGTQPWCDGNVGMYGTLWAGISQFEVAAEHPKYLKALAAGSVWSDTYEDASYPGGIFNLGLIGEWSFYTQPYLANRGTQIRGLAGPSGRARMSLPQPPSAGKSYDEMRSHPFKNAWWAERSFEAATSQIEMPTMICQGWQDEHVGARGALRLFERLKGPKRILLSNGGEATYGLTSMRAERIRWFDRWLKGEQNGVEKEPPATIWFETRQEQLQPKAPSEKGSTAQATPKTPRPPATPTRPEFKAGWISTFSAWPISETVWSTFYLTDRGGLSQGTPPSQLATGKRSYLYPAATEVPSTNEVFSASPAPLGCLAYRTAPMTDDLTIIGSPVLTLYVSSEAKDTDFMAVLHDVQQDLKQFKAHTTYIQRGFLRASHRALDAKNSSPHEPIHLHDKAEELTPGKIYEVTFSLAPVAHVVRKGHFLEVALMAPPTIPSPAWGFAPLMLPGLNTVHNSSQHPSRLELPVVPNLKAQAPTPPPGSLPLQPARELLPSWDSQRRVLDEFFQLQSLAGHPVLELHKRSLVPELAFRLFLHHQDDALFLGLRIGERGTSDFAADRFAAAVDGIDRDLLRSGFIGQASFNRGFQLLHGQTNIEAEKCLP